MTPREQAAILREMIACTRKSTNRWLVDADRLAALNAGADALEAGAQALDAGQEELKALRHEVNEQRIERAELGKRHKAILARAEAAESKLEALDAGGWQHERKEEEHGTPRPNCEDCGKPYPFGIDVVLSDADWLTIHPSGGDGLLCAGCIANRAAALPPSKAILVWARLIDGENHDAFCVLKNARLLSLLAAAQLSAGEIGALKAGIADIRAGRIVPLPAPPGDHPSAESTASLVQDAADAGTTFLRSQGRAMDALKESK